MCNVQAGRVSLRFHPSENLALNTKSLLPQRRDVMHFELTTSPQTSQANAQRRTHNTRPNLSVPVIIFFEKYPCAQACYFNTIAFIFDMTLLKLH